MKELLLLFLTAIILASCESETEIASFETENHLIGDWSGHVIFWSQDTLQGDGGMGWDYRITQDSIYILNYPTKFKHAHKITFLKDSVKFHNGSFESEYKWYVGDSTLTLVGKTFYGGTVGHDSMIFNKSPFDNEIISEIMHHGYNKNILELGVWKFDKENTVKYRW